MLSYIETLFKTKNANGIEYLYSWLDKHPHVRAVVTYLVFDQELWRAKRLINCRGD
jgi:hypothetical protein